MIGIICLLKSVAILTSRFPTEGQRINIPNQVSAMPYQEKAHIIFKYLRAKFPQYSIGHRWDNKLDCEWYFLQYEKLRIRFLVPKMFLQANNGDKLDSKLDALDLNSYIRSGEAHYIIIDNSGLDVHTF